jgi:hypothetical protein
MIPTTINTWRLRDLILRHVRQPHTSDSLEETEYSPLNRYPTGGCNLHDWTMTYNVSTSLDTAACRSVVASKSSPNRKVANDSQSFYPVATANATTIQLPTGHVGCWTSTSEKEDETGWKIIHKGELCGTERWRRIPLRLLRLHHDSRRVHVILHSQKCPRSSPRVTTQSQGTASCTGVECNGQVFLLVDVVEYSCLNYGYEIYVFYVYRHV